MAVTMRWGWWHDSGVAVMVERWRRGDEGGVATVEEGGVVAVVGGGDEVVLVAVMMV
ncbi:hypothetical protein Tco_1382042, partial [Tanacetum coccineum]